ncbi:olfactory receptor 5V1-like [Gopherus flavomarginatus]|uniref:olfactory receptor 5V1-like n=1 Tax=Gopherus flavomarginatus TaxID=286002 RepID=UPI0021CBEADB|nr:olfactory receptor 5V1-like [Gopherus flavomarginatus]
MRSQELANPLLQLSEEVAMENQTTPTEFILSGFSKLRGLRFLLLGVISIIYIFTLLGNMLILLLSLVDPCLRTPMYLFLRNLSLLDIFQTTTTIPQMLQHLLSGRSSISYGSCMAQLYFFLLFVGAEGILLATMAYDRYVAICSPLLYTVLMSTKLCSTLVAASWLIGSFNAAVHTVLTIRLSFCGVNRLRYFYCDIPPLLALSCGDVSLNVIVTVVSSLFLGWGPSLCIILSYVHIVFRILKMQSSQGRRKAFSTCASHLTVVLLYYGSCIFTYIRPISSYSLDKDRLISLLYSLVTPMLNPIIYTLRNKDVKGAMKKVFHRKMFF